MVFIYRINPVSSIPNLYFISCSTDLATSNLNLDYLDAYPTKYEYAAVAINELEKDDITEL